MHYAFSPWLIDVFHLQVMCGRFLFQDVLCKTKMFVTKVITWKYSDWALKNVQKTSEQVLITPPQNLNLGAPTLCATNTVTLIQNVICQRLSRERWFLCVGSKTHFFCIRYFSKTKHKSVKKNTGQCFTIELQFVCNNSDKSEQNWKTT